MRPFLLIATLIFSLSPLSAREWKNTTGEKSFEATYVSNDGKSVTLQRGGKLITFSIEKLHPDDQVWLKENHPGQDPTKQAPPPPAGAAFDSLVFGDSNKEVTEKLLASPMLESTVAEVMLTRIGLNGTFRTKETIGGLHCHVYFDWDENLKLKEVTLRTKGQPLTAYGDKLKKNWSELINLLSEMHGSPLQGAPYPSSSDLSDGNILGSHLWRSDNGHSVLLGTSQDGKDYSVIVRITSDKLKTNPTE